MDGRFTRVFFLVVAAGWFVGSAAAQVSPHVANDIKGNVIEELGSQGRSRHFATETLRPASSGETAVSGKTTGAGSIEKVCDISRDNPKLVLREVTLAEGILDACGRLTSASNAGAPFAHPLLAPESSNRGFPSALTIDKMTTTLSFGRYSEAEPLVLMGRANTYTLSDSSQWASGAGGYEYFDAMLDHVEVSGSTIRYVLSNPSSGLIYEQTDYDNGDHSAAGSLAPSGALVIEAQVGSSTAIVRGNAIISKNDATWYGEPRFNYYTSIVGSVVPFEVTISLLGGATWMPSTFQSAFTYTSSGWVDFAHPVSTPLAVELSIVGSARIPDESSTAFKAQVRYENDQVRNVTAEAQWSVESSGVASVAGGVVTVGPLVGSEQLLDLRATYSKGSKNLTAAKAVRAISVLSAEGPDLWPMFQSDAQHTGAKSIELLPEFFSLRWQRNIGGGYELNPVSAGEGKVFVSLVTFFLNGTSLFALRAADGGTIWSKDFGETFSVNPPSYAYGNVYIQTGYHTPGTWLHAFDGDTGEEIFKAPHQAQWERYFAPTIYNRNVYVNGGYYGGMYGFDAFTGNQLWFVDLLQVDQWTPAVAGDHAVAYLSGGGASGLYSVNRLNGSSDSFIPDPYGFGGLGMNLAPVIGDQDDVLVISEGRLVCFDLGRGAVRWALSGQFSGQPSVSQGKIYAIDNGDLVVIDEITHTEQWAWQPSGDTLGGPMIVTDSHLLVSGASNVYAIDLITHQAVWSYPVAGKLALADNTLYVASPDGVLTAFSVQGDRIFTGGFE